MKIHNLIINILFLFTIFMIPVNILGQGYMPKDDALRHCAKVISGKNWNELLIVRDYIKLDSHQGWHNILNLVHCILKINTRALVMFSVAFLFIWFSLIPFAYLTYAETWIFSLLAFASLDWLPFQRLFLGRPFIFTMSWVVLICFTWKKLRHNTTVYDFSFLLAYTTAVVLIQCAWPILALPVFGFFLAREYKTAVKLICIILCSVCLGALISGDPILFVTQNLSHVYSALFEVPKSIATTELQGFNGSPLVVFLIALIILYKLTKNDFSIKMIDNPVFIIFVLSYIFQYKIARIWSDIGFPAFSVWLSYEVCQIIKKYHLSSHNRLVIMIILVLTFYFQTTNDYQERWSKLTNINILSYNSSIDKEWLPETGGVVYNAQMEIFYKGFYSNPNAPWKYVLGFEHAWMREEDLQVITHIQRTKIINDSSLVMPWLDKMTHKDRLVFYLNEGKPDIPQLSWRHMPDGLWIGKKLNNTN
jgi:hypothetical protein